jgi:F-type H+-transporting ATPase subunit b
MHPGGCHSEEGVVMNHAKIVAVAVVLAVVVVVVGTRAGAVRGAAAGRAEAAQHAEAATPEHAATEQTTPNPLVIGPDLAVVTVVVFLLLLAVLSKFAWKPIVEALDRRERSIAENIAAAAAQNEAAKELLSQHEAKLRSASDEIREMLDEARRNAEAAKAGIIAEAKTAAQAEQQRAVREVQHATDAALRQLAEKSADLAVDLAGKIVTEKLTASDRARLVRDAVAQLPSSN